MGTDSISEDETSPPQPAEQPRLVRGQMFADKYVLLKELGSGGMGVVWLAERPDWGGGKLALKVLRAPRSRGALERFEREVQLMASLSGEEHVVHILDHGVDAALQLPFIAMRYLNGKTLEQRLVDLKTLSQAEVKLVMTNVGNVLVSAHRSGIIHRDLKPSNIFLVENHAQIIPKVLDFGLAKAVEGEFLESRPLTMRGAGVGTPGYMSPEQQAGFANDQFGDLWSLAVIAFECFVGKRPFGPTTIGERPVPSRLRSTVPPGFDAWFAKATDPVVARRYQTVAELVSALCRLCRAPSVIPPLNCEQITPADLSSLAPVSSPPPLRRSSFFSRRHRAVLAVSGTLAVTVVGLIAYPHVRPLASVAPTTSAVTSAALTPPSTPVAAQEIPVPPASVAPERIPPPTAIAETPILAPIVEATPPPSPKRKPHPAKKPRPPASPPPAKTERVGEYILFTDG